MIWLFVVLYFILGFAFLLIGQILNQKGYDKFDYFGIHEADDAFEFRLLATMTVLFWPVIFILFHVMILFIPWLITFLYKLFVGIIFGTIALFKPVSSKPRKGVGKEPCCENCKFYTAKWGSYKCMNTGNLECGKENGEDG